MHGQAVQGRVEIRPFTVHLGDHGKGGKACVLHAVPHAAHLRTHAVHGVHDDDGAVHGGKKPFHVSGEVGIAGDVDKIVTVSLPVKGGEAGLNGAATLDLFGFVVQGSGAFFYGAKTIDDSSLKQQHFCQRSLTAATGADKGVGALVLQSYGHTNLH